MEKSEIKKTIKAEFDNFTPNPMMTKAVSFIMSQEDGRFWTEEVTPHIGNAIGLVMALAGGGVLTEGSTGNKIAKMSQETGEITVATREV